MKDFERYVKVTNSDNLHSTLHTISHTCEKIHDETDHLRALEVEKHKIYAAARTESRSLLSDLNHLNRHLGEPQAFAVAKQTAPVRRRVVRRTVIRRKITPRARPRPARRTVARKAPARRPIRKAAPRPRPKVVAKRIAPKKSNDTENLKRLKANLDAIRSSLK